MLAIVIIIVIVIIVEFPRKETRGGLIAGGTVSVIQDELATSKYWLCGRLPVYRAISTTPSTALSELVEAYPIEYVF